jgi:type II secretory pathway pseudopilin PulG
MANRIRRCDGYGYLGLLLLLAMLSVAATAAALLGAVHGRRAAEDELLAIGLEFRAALISYADATPAGRPPSPQSLEELLKDPRYPQPRRHLRKLYADPLSGREEWGMLRGPDGGIVGVYSLAPGKPLKIGGFAAPWQAFADKTTYRDWVFAIPAERLGSAAPAPPSTAEPPARAGAPP